MKFIVESQRPNCNRNFSFAVNVVESRITSIVMIDNYKSALTKYTIDYLRVVCIGKDIKEVRGVLLAIQETIETGIPANEVTELAKYAKVGVGYISQMTKPWLLLLQEWKKNEEK